MYQGNQQIMDFALNENHVRELPMAFEFSLEIDYNNKVDVSLIYEYKTNGVKVCYKMPYHIDLSKPSPDSGE